jgi:redox-sensitive bicupin YhaK (pirin superfamily)
MDHFGPMVLPPATEVGFPPHPHKGFQTLTYLLQGAFRHRDSTGGAGTLRPGGAQLMTAGRGIVHEELPVPEHLETGGAIEGVQLWINLPQIEKGIAPGYVDLQPETLPWISFPGGRLKPLAGDWLGARGPARTPARIGYAHLILEPGATFEHAIAEGWTVAVSILHGAVTVDGQEVGEGQVGLFAVAGQGVSLASPGGASLMLLAGEPLGEPIAHYGPFVMNTREEIEAAILEYQSGKMGKLD